MPNNTGPMTKDNMVELLPCPFCGATFAAVDPVHVCEFEIDYDDGVEPEHRYRWSVQCDNCTATTGNCASEDDAIALWNTRATMHGSDSGVGSPSWRCVNCKTVMQMSVEPTQCKHCWNRNAFVKCDEVKSSASAPDSGALREALIEARRFMTTHPKELAAKIDAALNLSETGE